MDENQSANSPACAACGQGFDWEAAYRAQDTPASVPYNPPGHGVFRPRAYCPHCGALVAEWHIDRLRDYDQWAWYGENAALNAGKPLPPNPLLMWGKGIPTALLPTINEHTLAVDKIKQIVFSSAAAGAESVVQASEAPAATAAMPAAPVAAMAADTKICPNCGERIKLEARLCRFCRVRFELTQSGYCTNCHTVMAANPDGKCPTCQGELVDRHVESRLVEAAAVAAPAQSPAGLAGEPPSPARKKGAPGVLSFWQLYFLPNGRIDRKTFFLEGILPLVVLFALLALLWQPKAQVGATIAGALTIGLTWVLLMLITKRLHDIGASGWVSILWLTPLLAEPVAGLLGLDTSAGAWVLLSVFGLLLLTILLLRCIFVPGKAYFNRFGQETGFQNSDADSLSVKQTLKRRRLTLGIVFAVILLPAAFFSAARYLIDQNNLKQATQAYQQADCATAIAFYDRVLTNWRTADFGGLRQSAQARKETCLPYQAAVDQQAAGEYAAALAGFAALALEQPDTILGQAAKARVTKIFEDHQAPELAGVAACGRLAGLKSAGLIPQPETCLPELYMTCAESYQATGAGVDAVKMYQQMLVEFPDDARVSKAEAALLTFPPACDQAVLLANEPAIAGREDFLPRYYYNCGQMYDKQDSAEKAVVAYKRLLIDFPEHALASSAEGALLANQGACGAAMELQKESAVAGRGELMPRLFYHCGQEFEKDRNYTQAVAMYQAFVQYYPHHSLAEKVNTALASALVKAAKAAGAGKIERPQKSGSTGGGQTEVVIQNDSPESLRIVFSGPQARIEQLAACPTCTKWVITPFSCPEEGPIGRYTLPAGTYDVLVESVSDSGVTPFTGTWELTGGDAYYSCFYILERMGLP